MLALIYLVMVAVNWQDVPPSDLAIKINEQLDKRGSIADQNNAYIFFLGVSAPPDADPMTMGIMRHKWLEQEMAKERFDGSDDPLAHDYDFKSKRSKAVIEFAESCSKIDAECLKAFEQGAEIIDEWLVEEQWLLERYRALIKMSEYEEIVNIDVSAPLPSYRFIYAGQRLLLAKAWMLADKGNFDSARTLLEKDLSFWRMVLANSDHILTKMLATAAVTRHFKYGNLVLRRIPEHELPDAIPGSWHIPINLSERSMRRCLVDEWLFTDRIIHSIKDEELGLGPWGMAWWKIVKPFWQSQDSMNRYAEMILELTKLYDAPYPSVPDAIAKSELVGESYFRPFSRIFNATGDVYFTTYFPSTFGYALRIADLEGLRRAALVTANFRARGIKVDGIGEALSTSDIRDPYWNNSFSWDEETNSVVFIGLQPNERGQHSILF